MSNVIGLTAKVADGPEQTFKGRFAWALDRLVAAGEKGCTPIDQPAPRWSHYVYGLRRQGVAIETVTENHEGAYAGHHARYVLNVPVTVVGREVR